MMPLDARTLPRLLSACAQRWPDSPAVADGDTRLTFAELAAEVERFACALAARGVAPGDRVAIWAPNSWRWVVAALGTVTAGAVMVPINTRYKGNEAGYLLGRTRAVALVTDDGFLGIPYVSMLSGEDLPHLATVVVLNEVPAVAAPGESEMLAWNAFMAVGGDVDPALVRTRASAVRPEDVSDIFFTSGTTGKPKGAMLTHFQSTALYVGWSELADLREGDRYLLVNPFFNTFGYKAGIVSCLLRGATIVPQPVFDVETTLRLIAQERITVLPGPPTLYTSILDHPERSHHDLSSLRVAVTGATTVPVVLIERMRDELKLQTVLTAYGLTESCGTATMCRPADDSGTIATTSGRALDGVEVQIVDANGESLPPGNAGEVFIRGFNVMVGYFEDEAATRETISPDGWLRTGDVGVMDEAGNLRITDRVKDMFIVGGFNVYPAEIEQVLARHDAIAEVAVVGVPDERLGEVGCAFVVPRQQASVSLAEVTDYCRDRLANYKVPRHIRFVDSLPRNATGKVLKTVLRQSGTDKREA
ncbi:3-[(3aS,4S,7aS)-7a-methyl-1,5-dioxo-octahydro-1H- inden-4-yl]propanoyl:CoA ligase [Rhizocola hellebori]|uniref:3-[(3aS,4S,7aS)-7a-methyl-1,5-dioxo-octahydro-1H-inden-4-yl]propanoyl:CoA ligase n=1 Tax=Rhizocola hellebori TaxID=1392758 RepID=A0A8J3VGS9_9ACTN|nr:FadD3 family acyl-CoA ligase [Rhizocola hellebori]GIH06684.1 3-[(3aS,4S,7aS)-7a-methyl-1,5-dioxo-octahydro-1H- inden-4-yl]propanoyl:CoA ligase [Rhizocola hellebori]